MHVQVGWGANSQCIGLALGNGPYQFEGQFPLQTNHERPTGNAVNRLSGQCLLFDGCRQRETALQQQFVENVIRRPFVPDVIDVEVQLILQCLRLLDEVSVPCCEIGLGEFENTEGKI